ncbi:hypothetical protein [Neobacillus muris]|uniref:hypothetical protein n=1 Tax=Neobacillus muris TaxID=2941334 RepID=UPI00203ABF78|nr:hypothetical protein [Neobacillus muris]
MFIKINIVFSILFFLLGSNVLADSDWRTPASLSGAAVTEFAIGEAAVSQGQTKASESAAEKEKTSGESVSAIQSVDPKKAPLLNYILPISVGILSMIGIGSYWLIYRRNHL